MAKSDNKDNDMGLKPLFVLVGLMVLVLIYGVSRGFMVDSEHLPKRSIRLVVTYPGNELAQKAYGSVASMFEKSHPKVAVVLHPIYGSKYYQKVLIMMASGRSPDLMWMGQGFGRFARRGAFLDVSDRVKHDLDTSRFLPQVLSWYRINGKQLGVPFLIDMQFIACNVKMFKQAGVPIPEAKKGGWTYAQFLHDAKKLTQKKNGYITQYGYFGNLKPSVFGAQFISNNGLKAACDTPQMVQFLKTNLALMNTARVTPSVQMQQNAMDRIRMFATGQTAMLQAYTWDMPKLRHLRQSMDWTIIPNPTYKNHPRAQWASSQAVLISSKTRYPDAAWALCKAFLSPMFEKQMARIGLPSDLSLARKLADSGNPDYHFLGALLKMVNDLVPTPRVANLSQAKEIFSQACQSVWIGQNTPKQAMAIASTRINRMIKQQERFGS